jgi:hypothetical protein
MKRNFHVYIVESPNAPDLYHGRFEGEALEKTIKLSDLSCSRRLVVNREAFTAAFLVGIKKYFEASGMPLVIHISAHGNEEGIQLSSGETVSWEELRKLLITINEVLKGTLIVCMSSCKGYSGIRMAMRDDNSPLPFLAIIGPISEPTWGETNIAFATFYHLFAKGEEPAKAVEAMKIASGNRGFILDYAISARKTYLNLLKTYPNKINQPVAVSTLESVTPKDQSTLIKALK